MYKTLLEFTAGAICGLISELEERVERAIEITLMGKERYMA
jgi:hypothetical protein